MFLTVSEVCAAAKAFFQQTSTLPLSQYLLHRLQTLTALRCSVESAYPRQGDAPLGLCSIVILIAMR